MTMVDLDWEGIYRSNWGSVKALYPADVVSWEQQVKWAIPDISRETGEMAAAMLHFANLPIEGKTAVAPRPKQVIDYILAVRRHKRQSRLMADSVPFKEQLAKVTALAEAEDWMAVSTYCAKLNDTIAGEILTQIKAKFPNYRIIWPDDACESYERMYDRPCPWWRLNREATPLSAPETPKSANPNGDPF